MSHDEVPLSHVNDCATRRGDDAIAEELVAPLLAERAAVLSALSRPTGEDPVKAAQRIVAERDELATKLHRVRDAVEPRAGEDIATAAFRLYNERNDLRGKNASLVAALDSDSEGLRLERDDVRKVLDALPHETVTMAAQRVVDLSEARLKEIVRQAEQISKLAPSDGIAVPVFRHCTIGKALGMGDDRASFAAVIERAGQLHDDSVAYRILRGHLVEVIDAPADFADTDILDLLADRINGPIADAEDDPLEQVRQLEGDVATLKAALHVATRGQS